MGLFLGHRTQSSGIDSALLADYLSIFLSRNVYKN